VTSVIDLDTITLGQIIELNTGLTTLRDNVFFIAPDVPEPSADILVAVASVIGLLHATGRSAETWRRVAA
jgi:hypothetical protein